MPPCVSVCFAEGGWMFEYELILGADNFSTKQFHITTLFYSIYNLTTARIQKLSTSLMRPLYQRISFKGPQARGRNLRKEGDIRQEERDKTKKDLE